MKASEAEIKKSCEDFLQYAQNQGKLVWLRLNAGMIVVNGERRHVVKGCQRGTSDLFVLRNGQAWFIECKRDGAKQTDFQREFQQRVEQSGGIYQLVRSLEDMTKAFENFDAIVERIGDDTKSPKIKA